MRSDTVVAEYFANPMIRRALVVAVGIVVILLVRWLVNRALFRSTREQSTRYRLSKVVSTLSVAATVLLLTVVFSDQLGGITVALGVAGAGITFALQEVIVSLAGWIALTLRNFYKVGDRVMLGGIKGDVIDIGALRTTLFELGEWVDGDLYTGRVVRVANSFVFKEPVFNYSADFPFLWDELTVPIRHGSNRAAARKLMLDAAEAITGDYAREVSKTWATMTRSYVIEAARVTPMVTMVADQNWMTFTVRYVTNFQARRTTKDHLFERILDAIDQSSDISVASAAQEITLMNRRPPG